MKDRLQKLMAQSGLGSRRACEELIRQRRVRVNGAVAELGAKADPASDQIVVDDQPLRPRDSELVYIALNKPINVLSSSARHKKDERRTVRELVRRPGHLFMVGRLDADSQGLMVLTNDGDLTHRLTHPRFQHTRTYRATLYGMPDSAAIHKWERGVWLPEEESKTAPCIVRVVRNSQGLAVIENRHGGGAANDRSAASPRRWATRCATSRVPTSAASASASCVPGEWRELDAQELALLKSPDTSLKRSLAPQPALARPRPQRKRQRRDFRSPLSRKPQSRKPGSQSRKKPQR